MHAGTYSRSVWTPGIWAGRVECFSLRKKAAHQYRCHGPSEATMTRVSNGDMVGDLLRRKAKFFFTFKALLQRDLDAILASIYDIPLLFYYVHIPEASGYQAYLVYVGEIATELHYASNNSQYTWKDVNFNLIMK